MEQKFILVVDDDRGSREMLRECLERIGYTVVEAADGEEALKRFVPGRFDVVLSDIVMPKINGMDLFRKIKGRDENVVFILITGHPNLEDAVRAIQNGAYDYITKPFRFEDLKIKIDRAAEARRMDSSFRKVSGIMWALLISIPLWIVLGIVLGFAWRWF
jgi:DNA-binding NtrC family response regulator